MLVPITQIVITQTLYVLYNHSNYNISMHDATWNKMIQVIKILHKYLVFNLACRSQSS